MVILVVDGPRVDNHDVLGGHQEGKPWFRTMRWPSDTRSTTHMAVDLRHILELKGMKRAEQQSGKFLT